MAARILVVDDNPTNLKLACCVLENEGYTIESAQDAEEAMEIIRKSPFDLILVDIELPGMDGLTLTRKLKKDQATKNIPVVALTASAMKGDETKALHAGCIGYITKPIDTRLFSLQVNEFLRHYRLTKGDRN
jgi:two-component system, cell cycle response regulator DivK